MSRRRALKVLLGVLWPCLGLSSLVAWWYSGVPAAEVPGILSRWLDDFGLLQAVALILVLYTLRPLVLFPSTVMGVVSGLTFGPLLGCAVTVTGEMLGAGLAFSVTRLLGRGWVRKRESALLARWDRRLSRHGVLTTCILRLVMLPFDSVSYACGLTGLRARDFLLGTLLGGSLYFLGVTLLGGSASSGLVGDVTLGGVTVSHRALVLGMSLLSFALGLTAAWRLRHAYRDEEAAPQG